MRVLVVEDSAPVASSVRAMLERRQYAVDVAVDGDTGLEALLYGEYEVAILDVMLPRKDGFSLARSAREAGVQTPLLMLTARDALEDRVDGLDAGADDYLIKPFREEELVARVRALTRRAARPLVLQMCAGDVEIDPLKRQAAVRGMPLALGATEFRMLELFVRNPGMTLTRDHLLERLWSYDFDGSSNIVDVYVSQLRRKLKAAGAPAAIETVWGVGYRLRA